MRIKICCISSPAEAELAVRHGADAIGMVSVMPSGPGVIHEDLIAEIVCRIPPGVDSFLLTSLQDPESIIGQHRRCRTSCIQLCDRLTVDSLKEVRETLRGFAWSR
jgi:phosphoribosylanthranilate isomerase